MLLTQEHILASPISFTTCLEEIIELVPKIKFTKYGERIQIVPRVNKNRAKSNESCSIRGSRNGRSSISSAALKPKLTNQTSDLRISGSIH